MSTIEKSNERGSVLVLTLIAVLILSIMVTGLLTVGTTEIYTTQNYQMNRTAYYTAVSGIEDIRNRIYSTPDSGSVTSISISIFDIDPYIESQGGGMKTAYMTGSLKNREAGGTGVPIEKFDGFMAPTFPGISLGGSSSIAPVIWKVNVTAEASFRGKRTKKTSYAELITGVYSVLTVGY